MLWAGALSLFAIAVFYLLISAMILGLLLRSPFWTNALYAIALVSLTMQDTTGKFDDITAVNCVYMWKRHWKVWFSLVFVLDDLLHFSMQRADPPSTVSIRYWSTFRCQYCLYPLLQCWCWYQTIHERNVLDERYSSQMGKGKKKLSVIFIFFCSEWRAMLDHSLVCSTKQALSLYAIGVLYLSALTLSVIAMLMFTPHHSSRVFALDVWKRIFHPQFHSCLVISCDALGWSTVSIRYCSVLFAH